MLTVSDLCYYLAPTVRIYTYDRSIKDPQALRAETRLKDGRALREGMYIGYTVAGESGGQRGELTEARLLPPGSTPALDRSGKRAPDRRRPKSPAKRSVPSLINELQRSRIC
jgi:hypothetical protein